MVYNNAQTSAIMTAGMRLLREHLGVVESEIFITNIGSSKFDYTKWRENLWEDLTPAGLFERAAATEEKYGIPKGVEVI